MKSTLGVSSELLAGRFFSWFATENGDPVLVVVVVPLSCCCCCCCCCPVVVPVEVEVVLVVVDGDVVTGCVDGDVVAGLVVGCAVTADCTVVGCGVVLVGLFAVLVP